MYIINLKREMELKTRRRKEIDNDE